MVSLNVKNKIGTVILVLLCGVYAAANNSGEIACTKGDQSARRDGRSSSSKKGGEQLPQGDDLFPWPWGTECPFPWQEIEGSYLVTSAVPRAYTGHFLVFNVVKQANDNVKFLRASQYDEKGNLYASGHGFSEKDHRIVRAILKPTSGRKNYAVMVRSYVNKNSKSCKSGDLATAVTFCSAQDTECKTAANYLLKKIEE